MLYRHQKTQKTQFWETTQDHTPRFVTIKGRFPYPNPHWPLLETPHQCDTPQSAGANHVLFASCWCKFHVLNELIKPGLKKLLADILHQAFTFRQISVQWSMSIQHGTCLPRHSSGEDLLQISPVEVKNKNLDRNVCLLSWLQDPLTSFLLKTAK